MEEGGGGAKGTWDLGHHSKDVWRLGAKVRVKLCTFLLCHDARGRVDCLCNVGFILLYC